MSQIYKTEREIYRLITKRFTAPEWATFPSVPDGTGGNKNRTADALAMNLYPSRGLELHGFEIKTHRNDWLREKNNPQKADAVGRYCDRWWIVAANRDVALVDELPLPWGLLVPHGKTLRTAKKAELLTPAPITKEFLAGVLRAAQRAYEGLQVGMVHRDEIQAELKAEYKRGEASGMCAAEFDYFELKRLRATVEKFEAAAGLTMNHYSAGDIGNLVKALQIEKQEGNIKARALQEAKALRERSDKIIKLLQDENA